MEEDRDACHSKAEACVTTVENQWYWKTISTQRQKRQKDQILSQALYRTDVYLI
jgi:hypothetical protein